MINVILADDHQIVLDGLKLLIEQEKDICAVGEALNGKELLAQLARKKIDIAVIDIDMPQLDGIETTKKIKELYPEIKVLVLTMYNDNEYIKQLIEIGVSGYILKNRGKEELVDAIRKIAMGDEYYGNAVVKTLIANMKKTKKEISNENIRLTKREIDVLKLIANGLSTPQIADKLCIAPSTVETHRRNLIDKLNVPNSKALIRYAIENGY